MSKTPWLSVGAFGFCGHVGACVGPARGRRNTGGFGAVGTSGASTGGFPTGGSDTGGSSTGGAATGGTASGGTGTGGDPNCVPMSEVCDGKDNDCDGDIDEQNSLGCQNYSRDADHDGWGDNSDIKCLCAPTFEYPTKVWLDDCDDGDPTVPPQSTETCDSRDGDCSGSIDDGAAMCPCDQFWGNGGSAYLICESPLDWPSARTFCADNGYPLLTIESATENTLLSAVISAYSTDRWWMGFNDRSVEGSWVWEDGTPATYTNWGAGEPNDVGGEDCGQLNRFYPLTTWNDEPCSPALRFVCEAHH